MVSCPVVHPPFIKFICVTSLNNVVGKEPSSNESEFSMSSGTSAIFLFRMVESQTKEKYI